MPGLFFLLFFFREKGRAIHENDLRDQIDRLDDLDQEKFIRFWHKAALTVQNNLVLWPRRTYFLHILDGSHGYKSNLYIIRRQLFLEFILRDLRKAKAQSKRAKDRELIDRTFTHSIINCYLIVAWHLKIATHGNLSNDALPNFETHNWN